MTTHAGGFAAALSNIEPQRNAPGDDAANAKAAHIDVTGVLELDTKLQDWGLKTKLIGSYARRVSIRRVKDVDVFCRLLSLPTHWSPGEVLDHMYSVLAEHYGDTLTTQQHRSIKVDFPDYDLSVDAVPARPCGDDWEVPSRVEYRHKWVRTNPLELNRLTSEMNQREDYVLNGNGVYVPTVKLVRQIRRHVLDTKQPGSLYMELMTYWVFDNGIGKQSTYADYITKTLRGIADSFDDVIKNGLDDPTIDDATISTRADKSDLEHAATKFADAASLAERALCEEDDCESARLWSQLLGVNAGGDVFPIPDYCQGQKSASVAAPAFIPSRTPGADRAPERPGRFA